MTSQLSPLVLPDVSATSQWLTQFSSDGLERAKSLVAALKADRPTDTIVALRQMNEVDLALGNVASVASLLAEVHPDSAVRAQADAAMQELQSYQTSLGQDGELYAVFARLSAEGLEPSAARMLEHTLRDFRRAGVDRDEETRQRLTAIAEREVLLGQEISKTIRDDVRSIKVTPDRLAGLPADWIEAHPADEEGLVTVTTNYPDAVPFRTFAHDRDARRDLAIQFLTVGWPDNDARWRELFALRLERAALLGFDSWPDFDTDVKMIGSGQAISDFVDKIAAAAKDRAAEDKAILLARLRQDIPDATDVSGVDMAYYSHVVQREQYAVDAQEVRTYFDFTRVRDGLLEVTGTLFGLTWVPVPDAVVWDPDVTAYDVLLGEERIGRVYLDLHPRDGKYTHAAQFDLARGVAGRQLAEGVLVCNFSRGLLAHSEVVTFFHEFGHLVHHVLAGRGDWARFSGVATEWDFVEAPSQLLEEWAWDPSVLARFATNADGAVIPTDLVERMRRADDFGKGLQARTQMFYAAMSYDFHVRLTDDLTSRLRELQTAYSDLAYIPDTHMYCAFGHLDGYSSAYYTYMWSLVIAKDLFSGFDPANLLDPQVGARYRDAVLVPGGSRDAADLIEAFLGRPYTFDAYARWLDS